MDIKEQIEKVISLLTKDEALKGKFTKDPMGTVKELLGCAIDDDLLKKIVSGVKAKVSSDKLSDAAGAIGKLFSKK